jgi:hypothetical protein
MENHSGGRSLKCPGRRDALASRGRSKTVSTGSHNRPNRLRIGREKSRVADFLPT